MRSGQDMRFLKEAAEIFTQYLPEDKRDRSHGDKKQTLLGILNG
ncbi:MAG: hypothetical protein R3A12_15715 [Ignavibacteria bacterium]